MSSASSKTSSKTKKTPAKKQGFWRKLFISKNDDKAARDGLKDLSYGPVSGLVVAIGAFIAANVGAVLLLYVYPFFKGWNTAQADHWFATSAVSQFCLFLFANAITAGLVYWFLRARKQKLEQVGLARPRPRDLLFGLAALPVYLVSLALLLAFVASAIKSVDVDAQQQLFTAPTVGPVLILVFIALVLLPPLVEEAVFRGFLFTGLRKKLPFLWTTVIVSAIFGSLHLSGGSDGPLWVAAIDTAVLSFFLCYLREKTGSIWASVTLHMLKNLIAFIGLFVIK